MDPSRRHPRTALVACLAAGLLALTGCQTEPDAPAAPSSTSPGVPTTSAEPEPSGTPEPTAPTEPAEPTEPDDDASGTPDDGATENGPNRITAPAPGETVTGPKVVVRGEGTAFEAVLLWRVVQGGDDVDEGFTEAGANGEVGPFEIPLTLDPGEYTVVVWEPDASDGASGEGPERNRVEVTFTVG